MLIGKGRGITHLPLLGKCDGGAITPAHKKLPVLRLHNRLKRINKKMLDEIYEDLAKHRKKVTLEN